MEVLLDPNKIQMVISYLNNVRMSNARRDELHCMIIEGILKGSLDMNTFLARLAPFQETGVERFAQEMRTESCLRGWVQAEELYEKYVQWCEQRGVVARSMTVFGRVLRESGVRKKSASDANYYTFDEEREGLHSA